MGSLEKGSKKDVANMNTFRLLLKNTARSSNGRPTRSGLSVSKSIGKRVFQKSNICGPSLLDFSRQNDSQGCSVNKYEHHRPEGRAYSQTEPSWLTTGVFLRQSYYLLRSSESTSVVTDLWTPNVSSRPLRNSRELSGALSRSSQELSTGPLRSS